MQQHYFHSVLQLRAFQGKPVLKQQLNYPVITFCFINFITKFYSTMDTITPCNTTSMYQGSPLSIYKRCDNNNQACLFYFLNFLTTLRTILYIIVFALFSNLCRAPSDVIKKTRAYLHVKNINSMLFNINKVLFIII